MSSWRSYYRLSSTAHRVRVVFSSAVNPLNGQWFGHHPDDGGINSNTVLISRQKLYDIIKSSRCETTDEKFNLIKIEIEKQMKNCEKNYFKKKLSYFKSEYKSRWEKAHRVEE
ncbi:hypothetical protein QTP88_025614 [Uroleucon formosanum]